MARKQEQQSESSDDDPSQEVIAERAAAIRATWSERVERERRVWHGRVEWKLPWIGSESVEVLQDDTAETTWCEKH
jgi:hypothetical protein